MKPKVSPKTQAVEKAAAHRDNGPGFDRFLVDLDKEIEVTKGVANLVASTRRNLWPASCFWKKRFKKLSRRRCTAFVCARAWGLVRRRYVVVSDRWSENARRIQSSRSMMAGPRFLSVRTTIMCVVLNSKVIKWRGLGAALDSDEFCLGEKPGQLQKQKSACDRKAKEEWRLWAESNPSE